MALLHDDVMAAVGNTWFRCCDRGTIFEFEIQDCEHLEEELSDRADMGEARRIFNALKDMFPKHMVRLLPGNGTTRVTITKADMVKEQPQVTYDAT